MTRRIGAFIIVIILLFLNINSVGAYGFYQDIYGHWSEEAVMWGTNNEKLFTGYDDGTFRPDNNITRSEFTALLYRAASIQGILDKNPDDVNKTNEKILEYDDIGEEFWAYDSLNSVAQFIDNKNSIRFSDIFPGNKLMPNNHITREEAVILSSFFTSPSLENKHIKFVDIPRDYKYIEQITTLVNNGIVEGYNDNTFKLNRNITRGESATLIKKIYMDMDYLKNRYLQEIELLPISGTKSFPKFGDYSNSQTKEDVLYRKAIETIEYKDFVKYIPYEERHLYDPNPIDTIKKLKESDYWNKVGVNYYLIRYDNLEIGYKRELYLEILLDYIGRNDLSDNEINLIIDESMDNIKDFEILLDVLDKWYNTSVNKDAKYNAIFLKSKVYLENGNPDTALELYIEFEKADELNIRKYSVFNKAYLLLNINRFNEAEELLREEWNTIKTDDRYIEAYDREFEGAIKEILIRQKQYDR